MIPVVISWSDTTRFREFKKDPIGRKILARALSKTAVSGKTEAKKKILEVFTVRSSKFSITSTPARKDNLLAYISAYGADMRQKYLGGIPVSEFNATWTRPRGLGYNMKVVPPAQVEIIRGQSKAWRGVFSIIGANSRKTVFVYRDKGATAEQRVINSGPRKGKFGSSTRPLKTAIGPSAGLMFINPRVMKNVEARVVERLPVVLEQEVNFAMNYETDKGKDETGTTD